MQYFGFDRPSFGIKTFGFGDSFSPLELFASGKQGVWYDPSDKSSLFQDVAGTVPVTKDGDPVALMKDKSGNGNHTTQVMSASRPVYQTDGELHWLYFDGVDDFMQLNKDSFAADKSQAILSAHNLLSNGYFPSILSGYPGDVGLAQFYLNTSGERHVAVTTNSGTATGRSLHPITLNTIVVRSTVWSRADGIARDTANNTDGFESAPPLPNAYLKLPTDYYTIGSRRSAEMRLYGLIAISDDLDVDATSSVGSYLAKKSGVTL